MTNPTSNYGFVLPTSTDLVTDLPADFDVALQGVDTRLKALQPGTTLGDLAYASATANTNTRLGIGTTGQVLSVSGGVPAWSTPAGGSLNWTLLNAGGTSLAGASTSITGLSGYDNLVIAVRAAGTAGTNDIYSATFNSDTGSNYFRGGVMFSPSNTYSAASIGTSAGDLQGNASYPLGTTSTASGTRINGIIVITGAKGTGVKMLDSDFGIQVGAGQDHNSRSQKGWYNSASAISSVQIAVNSTFSTGTVFVYGA